MATFADRLKIARHVTEMLEKREHGLLKPSADDYISGLIKGYALITDVGDQDAALRQIAADVTVADRKELKT